jgi:hypothetical protein
MTTSSVQYNIIKQNKGKERENSYTVQYNTIVNSMCIHTFIVKLLNDLLQNLREEAGALKKPLQSVRQLAGDLTNEAGEHGVDATHLQDEVENLADRLDDLQAKLDDRCSELQSAATAVTQFNVS